MSGKINVADIVLYNVCVVLFGVISVICCCFVVEFCVCEGCL